ncbi:transposase [Antarctobacter heliothermus]|uniref:transposase n=1 Tax=Antarctobacter heliothermus TaxID=74033 RepID=UPI0034A0B407
MGRTLINGGGKIPWQVSAKRRLWRKIHIGVDEQTLEIRAIEITGSNVGDAPMLPELLDQIPADVEICSVTADGAYDTRRCHDAVADRGADAVVIPPRKNGRPWKPSYGRRDRQKRGAARLEIPRPRHLAKMDRFSQRWSRDFGPGAKL